MISTTMMIVGIVVMEDVVPRVAPTRPAAQQPIF
jgi:hypothetical protein